MADLVETVARAIDPEAFEPIPTWAGPAGRRSREIRQSQARGNARIAIAAVREAEGWRTDTESAPKDGTDVLLWMDGRPPVVAGLFGGEWRLWDTGEALRFPHGIEAWMPLPQPPESGE